MRCIYSLGVLPEIVTEIIMNKASILIIDSDRSVRDLLNSLLSQEYNVFLAESRKDGLTVLEMYNISVVLLDMSFYSGEESCTLRDIKEHNEDVEVVVMAAIAEVGMAIQSMKEGAFYYITKELMQDEVVFVIELALQKRDEVRDCISMQDEVRGFDNNDYVTSKSENVRQIFGLAEKIARFPATVMITGHSGTGKEVIARYIWKQSNRADMHFVTLDLATIPDNLIESILFGYEKGAFTSAHRQKIGKFELADGGTMFLDEIGQLKYELQGKLLRVIQQGEMERVGGMKTIKVNVRLIAATNVDLQKEVKEGRFREDLFYRLNVIPIKMPRLEERKEDIPALVEFFIRKWNSCFERDIERFSERAMEILMDYHWPGNIRELENLIGRLVAISENKVISEVEIPDELFCPSGNTDEKGNISPSNDLKQVLFDFERNFIVNTLLKENNNKTRTATKLGIPLSTLKFKLKKFNINNPSPSN